MTDKQRSEIKRLWKSGKRSVEIAKSLRLSVGTVASFAANMNRKNSPAKKATKNNVVTGIANTFSKRKIEEVVAFHNKNASAKHFINEIKGMKKSNPKVYNEIIKGVKSLA